MFIVLLCVKQFWKLDYWIFIYLNNKSKCGNVMLLLWNYNYIEPASGYRTWQPGDSNASLCWGPVEVGLEGRHWADVALLHSSILKPSSLQHEVSFHIAQWRPRPPSLLTLPPEESLKADTPLNFQQSLTVSVNTSHACLYTTQTVNRAANTSEHGLFMYHRRERPSSFLSARDLVNSAADRGNAANVFKFIHYRVFVSINRGRKKIWTRAGRLWEVMKRWHVGP